MTSLYAQLQAAGCQLDNHESDLYVLLTPEAQAILGAHQCTYTVFTSQIDHKVWADVPFMYEPWWQQKTVRP